MVIEGQTLSGSIARSWALTKGYKRWILLIFIMILVLNLVISMTIGNIKLIAGTPADILLTGSISNTYIAIQAVTYAITQTIVAVINAVFTSAIYYEIRNLKEGLSSQDIGAVFD